MAAQGVSSLGAETPGTFDNGRGAASGQGWFSEVSVMWPGQALSLKVDEVLYHQRSQFQDVAVFRNAQFGNVLVLDGVIQCTDRDEHSYQEMIGPLPLCSLARPAKRVLVIGGGDGGVVRELTRHASLEVIDQAEIDGDVPKVSREFFPNMAVGFDDPRVNLRITDGLAFLREQPENTYDAIIVDSSDPVGPAEVLFQRPFFESMHRALRPGGVICTQGESLWLHIDIITEVARMCKEVFVNGTVQYAFTTIPTYPSGQIGFMLCAKADPSSAEKFDFSIPRQPPPAGGAASLKPLRYYDSDVHRAAFVLPKFAREALADHLVIM